MIPIVDEQEKYDSLVENFYLLIERRMGKSNESAPSFFSRFMSISRRPSIESQASIFRYYSSHSQIWYLCNKP